MRAEGEQLAHIAKLVKGRKIGPVIDCVFGFAETPAAMDRVAAESARSEVVSAIADMFPPTFTPLRDC